MTIPKHQPIVRFQQWDCAVEYATYRNTGRVAIELIDPNDETSIAVATVNVPEAKLEPDEVIIKDYSENEGMLDALVNAGIVEPTGVQLQVGFARCPIARLLVKPGAV